MTQEADRARTVLPVPDPPHGEITATDAKDPETTFPPIEPLRPPDGRAERADRPARRRGLRRFERLRRPVLDADRRAARAGGLKYNRFHTTALCSPTRQALLTGRNHHTVGMGGITEIATSAPGLQLDPAEARARPLAETLKLNGYSTAQFGKCHEVPGVGDEPDGPVRRLADRRRGFEYFYGFIGGETNQYYPAIYEGTIPVEPETTPEEGYHFTEDMTDRAIDWIRQQKALMPDKPFFVVLRARARPTPRTTCRRNGRTSTRGSSTTAGTRCASETLRAPEGARRHPGRRRADRRARRRSRPGTTCPTS